LVNKPVTPKAVALICQEHGTLYQGSRLKVQSAKELV
jgi:hypothetical protein